MYLTAGPISPDIILQLIKKMGEKNDTGGHTIFLGQVRADITEGKMVKAIEYSAYVEMVNAEAEKIKALVYSEFEDIRSALDHIGTRFPLPVQRFIDEGELLRTMIRQRQCRSWSYPRRCRSPAS